MTTPIGHGITGLALNFLLPAQSLRHRLWVAGLLVVSACAADLDFVPGILIQDVNVFHRGPSHSLVMALVWGALVWIVARRFSSRALIIASLAALAYASHMLLDFLGTDTREPFGIPLLWPFSDMHFAHDPGFFAGIRHGVPGDSLATSIGELMSPHNFRALGLEIVATVPVLLLCWVVGKLMHRGGSR